MLIINNRDMTDLVTNISYQSQWNNGAGIFRFEYPCSKATAFENGATVTFTYEGTSIFYGFLFKIQQNKKVYQCTCYDQLRYLKASNSILRQVQPLDQFLKVVATSIGERIRLGKVDQTAINLSKHLFDNKTHLDMIYESIKENLMKNGYWYTLRDRFGVLDLLDTVDLRLPLVIGDHSLATDFDYVKSIDTDTFNFIKIAKDNKDAGVRDVYIAQDSQSIAKWGKLMLYEKVTTDLNSVQLAQQANMMLKLKNKETETLQLSECIGDVRVMGGSGIKIEIQAATLDMWAVVESVTHTFSRAKHTMELKLLFGR